MKFNDEQQSMRAYRVKTPKIVQWTMRFSGGLIKSEKQANYVILVLVGLAIIISMFLLLKSSGSDVRGPIPEGTSETVPG